MQKIILFSVLLLNVMLFASCKKEDPILKQHEQLKENLSAKKWKLVSSEIVLPSGNEPKEIEPCRLDNIWEYKKDGSFALYVGEELCSETETTHFGTWKLSDDNSQIEYSFPGIGSYADEVVEISADKVVLRFTTDNVFTETYMPL